MVTAMPVPLEFQVPDGWTPANPDAVGAPGVAFAALHTASQGPGFTTNITLDGQDLPPHALLTEIADESIETLQQAGAEVALTQRTQVGTPDAPGLTQLLHVTAGVEGTTQKLVQCQVYLAMSDVVDDRKRALVRMALTSTETLYGEVLPGFQEFVASVRPTNATEES